MDSDRFWKHIISSPELAGLGGWVDNLTDLAEYMWKASGTEEMLNESLLCRLYRLLAD